MDPDFHGVDDHRRDDSPGMSQTVDKIACQSRKEPHSPREADSHAYSLNEHPCSLFHRNKEWRRIIQLERRIDAEAGIHSFSTPASPCKRG